VKKPWNVVGPVGVYLWPSPQAPIDIGPVLPARTVEPPVSCIAVGTLLRLTFSRIKLPAVAGTDVVVQAVIMPTGVFVIVLSMIITEPTFWAADPPAEMSIPFWQLFMLMPW
jgi:hypothetical protein